MSAKTVLQIVIWPVTLCFLALCAFAVFGSAGDREFILSVLGGIGGGAVLVFFLWGWYKLMTGD